MTVILLKALGFPCGRLLFLYYLAEPPVKDYRLLYEILSEEALKIEHTLRVKGPAGIPNLLTNCKQRFRDFLRARPDDLDELFFNQ